MVFVLSYKRADVELRSRKIASFVSQLFLQLQRIIEGASSTVMLSSCIMTCGKNTSMVLNLGFQRQIQTWDYLIGNIQGQNLCKGVCKVSSSVCLSTWLAETFGKSTQIQKAANVVIIIIQSHHVSRETIGYFIKFFQKLHNLSNYI